MEIVGDYPEAYRAYLIEFHAARDYFECHELLEDYWKAHPGDPLADTWVGLIQIAVGSYHYRRGNLAGAVKMYRQSLSRLTASQLERVGIDGEAALSAVAALIAAAEEGEPFRDIDLPLRDQALAQSCEAECERRGLIWGAASGSGAELVQRHTLRDRSGVIAAREAAAAQKRTARAKADE